ncbi:MAG: bifunctional metallophosphatase/5'-nucleotidase, partial [Paludibacteraceae bacterium]|nr:bifunctional metallophosphatase/5'-nucleotidase [Paludibacteraceae bacterium]
MKLRHLIIFACACAMTLTGCTQRATALTILHTNDTHSQVDPTNPKAEKNADMGGYARRMGFIAEERKADPNLLLLDAGDFSQGSPFFNYFR